MRRDLSWVTDEEVNNLLEWLARGWSDCPWHVKPFDRREDSCWRCSKTFPGLKMTEEEGCKDCPSSCPCLEYDKAYVVRVARKIVEVHHRGRKEVIMKEELYKKEGRKYIRVNDPWAYDGLQEGHHHVWVRPGSVTIREFILPYKREVSAAIEEVREAMIDAMQEANKSGPSKRLLSARETRAVKAYRKVMGEDAEMIFDGISMCDLVDAGIKVLKEHYYGD